MLENIKFSYVVAEKQNNLFTNQHVVYKCKIQYNGKSYTFTYQCNPRYTKPELRDVLDCLFSDASAGQYELDDFFSEFGYTKPSEAIKAHKACIRTMKALERLFGDEYEAIQDEIQGL